MSYLPLAGKLYFGMPHVMFLLGSRSSASRGLQQRVFFYLRGLRAWPWVGEPQETLIIADDYGPSSYYVLAVGTGPPASDETSSEVVFPPRSRCVAGG